MLAKVIYFSCQGHYLIYIKNKGKAYGPKLTHNVPDKNEEGARALALLAPSLVPRPGCPLVVPQPSSSSPGWCFLRGIRPRCSAVVFGSAEDAFWPRSPTAHSRPTPAQRGDAAPRPVPCPHRAFARVVAARTAPPRRQPHAEIRKFEGDPRNQLPGRGAQPAASLGGENGMESEMWRADSNAAIFPWIRPQEAERRLTSRASPSDPLSKSGVDIRIRK
jgi:hypothetical protein